MVKHIHSKELFKSKLMICYQQICDLYSYFIHLDIQNRINVSWVKGGYE